MELRYPISIHSSASLFDFEGIEVYGGYTRVCSTGSDKVRKTGLSYGYVEHWRNHLYFVRFWFSFGYWFLLFIHFCYLDILSEFTKCYKNAAFLRIDFSEKEFSWIQDFSQKCLREKITERFLISGFPGTLRSWVTTWEKRIATWRRVSGSSRKSLTQSVRKQRISFQSWLSMIRGECFAYQVIFIFISSTPECFFDFRSMITSSSSILEYSSHPHSHPIRKS